MNETRADLEKTLAELRRRLARLESRSAAGEGDVPDPPASAEPVRTLLDGLADPVLVCDRETLRVVECNRAAVEQCGYGREELRSMALPELHPVTERERVAAALRGEQRETAVRTTLQRGDASELSVELRCRAAIVGVRPVWVTTVHDISETMRAEEDLRQSERRLDLLLGTLPVALYTAAGPVEEGTTWASGRLEELTGFPVARFVRDPSFWTSRLHPDDRERVLAELERVEGSEHVSLEYRWLCRDGRYRWFLDQPVPTRDREGRMTGRMGVWVDITGRKRAEQALRDSEEKYSRLFHRSYDGILVYELDGTIVDCNERAAELLGQSREQLMGSSVVELHPADSATAYRAASEKLRRDGFVRFETDLRRLDGEVFVAEVSSSLLEVGGRSLAQAILRDVTARKRSEAKLQHDALHDPLTGLANRSLFVDRLQVSLDRFRRRGNPPFAVLFLDLDGFKEVNDRLGHHVGDQFLVALARRMEEAVRPGDTVARLHGDEFTVLVSEIGGLDGAVAVAERLQAKLAAPLKVAGHELRVSASMGITLSLPVYRDVAAMMRDADAAMYRAKEQGGACYAVLATGEGDHDRLHLEEDLARAVDGGELQLLFQPVLRLDGRRVRELEALVRWHHPRRGLLTAAAFLSHAEATGLVTPIGDWVLRDACRAAAEWRRRWPGLEGVGVSVNLFSRQASQPELPDLVAEELRRNGLSGADLSLEVTEDVILEAAAVDVLGQLRAQGVRVWLDDFGTGYSSMSSLHQLPIDGLKIDRAFVAGLDSGGPGARVVRTMAALAREIGVQVVAEGVESAEQLEALRALGVEAAQGNYLSPPLTMDELEGLAEEDAVER